MKFHQTDIEGLIVLEPDVFGDKRGYFLESYNAERFSTHIPGVTFIQDNESSSSKGTLRGLHFQNPPYAQAKLVRVIQGEVLDVAVDLRKNSSTYGKSFSIILNEQNKKQLFVPRGFAHGFAVLSDTAIFAYKVDNLYFPTEESGIAWNDPTLNIDWGLPQEKVTLSEKDKHLLFLADFKSPF